MIFVITILIIKTLALIFFFFLEHKSLKVGNYKSFYLDFFWFIAFSFFTWFLIAIAFSIDKIVSSEVNIFAVYSGIIYGIFLIFTFIKNLKYQVFAKIGNWFFLIIAGILIGRAICNFLL